MHMTLANKVASYDEAISWAKEAEKKYGLSLSSLSIYQQSTYDSVKHQSQPRKPEDPWQVSICLRDYKQNDDVIDDVDGI